MQTYIQTHLQIFTYMSRDLQSAGRGWPWERGRRSRCRRPRAGTRGSRSTSTRSRGACACTQIIQPCFCVVDVRAHLRTTQSVRPRNCSQEWLGPKVFTRQLAYYERKIWQERVFSRNYFDHVFNVTFWDLCTALLIDSMRLRKGFLWKFWGFPGFSSLRWDQKFIFLISGETITKDKGSCDGLESGLRLSRK